MRNLAKKSFCPAIFLLLLLWSHCGYAAQSLQIRNMSGHDILNIMLQPEEKTQPPIFIRLDLAPGAADKVEIPPIQANMRVDTGLELQFFENMPLAKTNVITFCNDQPACIVIEEKNGELKHFQGKVKNLTPAPRQKPVCELELFRPRMPMKDVCSILESDLPTDDNGAVLTGLGFAGMVWAARLIPAKDGPVTPDSQLEHLELRRNLDNDSWKKALNALFRLGYTPWQAELPGQDLDFMNMPGKDESARQEILEQALDNFFKKWNSRMATPQINNTTDEEAEATIMLAPASNLQALANADEPSEDVQLFTLIVKPLSHTLLLDVAAYQGEKKPEATPAQ